jgi:hypothetical protein
MVGHVCLDGSHPHPLLTWESSLPAKVRKLSMGYFFSPPPEKSVHSGLVKFRWPIREDGVWRYLPVERHPFYSEEQYTLSLEGGYEDFVEAVSRRIDMNVRPPMERLLKAMRTTTAFLQERVPLVLEGYRRCRFGKCRENSKEWEKYNTIDRDRMIISMMDSLCAIIESNGLDREFDTPPRWTFMELSSQYTLPPFLETHFTPSISGYVYRSWASREDLGLSQYEYLILRGTLAPGVTLFEQFRLNVGYGIERVYLYKSKTVEGVSPRIETVDTTDDWTFIEARMNIDLFPALFRNFTDRFAYVTYRYYMNEVSFHRFTVHANFEIERENFDILSIKTNNVLLSHSAPFYYEESVEGQTFKGFQGKSYHTKKIARLSGSYRFSLYRDYLFAGIFTDGTVFQGSGYDLSGIQKGIAGGISGHVIFLDQF